MHFIFHFHAYKAIYFFTKMSLELNIQIIKAVLPCRDINNINCSCKFHKIANDLLGCYILYKFVFYNLSTFLCDNSSINTEWVSESEIVPIRKGETDSPINLIKKRCMLRLYFSLPSLPWIDIVCILQTRGIKLKSSLTNTVADPKGGGSEG